MTQQTCARCGKALCGCSDHHWLGRLYHRAFPFSVKDAGVPGLTRPTPEAERAVAAA